MAPLNVIFIRQCLLLEPTPDSVSWRFCSGRLQQISVSTHESPLSIYVIAIWRGAGIGRTVHLKLVTLLSGWSLRPDGIVRPPIGHCSPSRQDIDCDDIGGGGCSRGCCSAAAAAGGGYCGPTWSSCIVRPRIGPPTDCYHCSVSGWDTESSWVENKPRNRQHLIIEGQNNER